jgi:hypothetical protein
MTSVSQFEEGERVSRVPNVSKSSPLEFIMIELLRAEDTVQVVII